MYSESKEPSRSGWRWPWGKSLQCTVDGKPLPRRSWLTATYQLYSLRPTAIVANCTNLGQLAILHTECCQLPGAASQRTAHNSHCLLNLSLFQKKSYEHYHVIKFLGHLKTLSFWVLLYIYSSPYLSKDKEVEWRKSVFYYLFNLVKSKRKAYQEKKGYGCYKVSYKNMTLLHK